MGTRRHGSASPPASRYTALLACLLFAGLATPAWGQQPCGPRDEVVKYLEDEHKEVLHFRALMDNGPIMEIYISPEGSYTVLVSPPDASMACVAASGKGWTPSPAAIKGRGA
jgi:hypothetical protein